MAVTGFGKVMLVVLVFSQLSLLISVSTCLKKWKWKSLSCLTLCDPMDYTVHGILQARILEWVALPFSRGYYNSGIESRSPSLQADSLPTEPPEKPKNTGVNSYLFSRGSSWPRSQTGVSRIAGKFFTNWAIRETPKKIMLWKSFTQCANKFGKLSSGHRNGKGQYSFQSQRRATTKLLKLLHNCIHLTR